MWDGEWIANWNARINLRGKIHAILGTRRLLYVRVLFAGQYPAVAMPAFCDKMYDSLEDGIISEEQYVRVIDADVIVRARRRKFGEGVYVAANASKRLRRDDVDRMEKTRRALAAVFPQSEIRAMLYGVEISDEVRLHAESKGVETFLERDCDF